MKPFLCHQRQRQPIVKKTRTKFWTPQQLLLTGCGPDGDFAIETGKPFAIVGAHDRADLSLTGEPYPRRKFIALISKGGVYIVDLAANGESGEFVGFWAEPGRKTEVGEYQIEFGILNAQVAIKDQAISLLNGQSRSRPFPLLSCQADDNPLGNHYLKRRLSVIGRNPACTFQFTTRSISSEHCWLYQERGKVWVIDSLSSSKTRVDGKAVKCARLYQGAELQIGRVKIDFQAQLAQDSTLSNEEPDPHSAESSFRLQPGRSQQEQEVVLETEPIETNIFSPSEKTNTELDVQDQLRQLDELTRQKQNEQVHLEELRQAVEETQKQLDDAKQGLTDVNQQFETTQRGLDDAKTKHNEQIQQLDSLREKIESQTCLEQTQKQELSSLNQSLIEQKHELASTEQKLEKKVEAAEQQLAARESELANQQLAIDSSLEDLSKEREKLESERHEFESRFAKQQLETNQLEVANQSLTEVNKRLENRIIELEANFDEKNGSERRNSEKIKELQSELELRVSDFDSQRNKWELELETKSEELQRTQKRLTDLEQSLSDRQRQSDEEEAQRRLDSEEQIQKLRELLSSREQRLDRQKADLDTRQTILESELEELQKQRDESNSQHSRLLQQIDDQKQELTDLKELLSNYKQDGDRQMVALEKEFESEKAELQHRLDHLAEQDRVRTQGAKDDVENLRRQHSAETEKLAQQVNELSAIRAQLQSQNQSLAEQHAVEVKNLHAEIERQVSEISEFESRNGSKDETHVEEVSRLKSQIEQLQQQIAALGDKENELNDARKKLEADQREFDRFMKIDTTQRNLLANLHQIEREKRPSFQLFRWLTRPFRK